MSFDSLPNLVLHHILLYCEANDVESIRKTDKRLYSLVTYYRIHYKKVQMNTLSITKSADGQRRIEMIHPRGSRKTLEGLLNNNLVNSLNPKWLKSYDHDELLQMSRLWWRDRKNICLTDVVDYRKYLPFLNDCHRIELTTSSSINLSTMLEVMQSKSLSHLRLFRGVIECKDDDLRKIGQISNKMSWLTLENLSETSHITNDAVLDMIEIGSFYERTYIFISQISDFQEMGKCLEERTWVRKFEKLGNGYRIDTNDGRIDIGTNQKIRS